MKTYTEKQLIEFGNYLLSKERKAKIKKKVNINSVHDCDIENFKTNNPT